MRTPMTAVATFAVLTLALAAPASDTTLPAPARPDATAPATEPATAPALHNANELLSGEELHKLADAGQYKDALRGLARVLALRGIAAAPYDRHDLLMLRAECLLQTRDNAAALSTLALARRESAAANKPDEVMLADALAELIQKSPGGIYQPKTGSSRLPIKILDRSVRKSAYDALFADQFTLFQQKAAAASNSKTLPPFMDAAKFAASVRAAEFASTGSNVQTAGAIKDLADHAVKLINDVLDDLGARQNRISAAANREITETYNVGGGRNGGMAFQQQRTHKTGLVGDDANQLKNIMETCKKIPPAIQQLADAFGAEQDTFKAAAAKADDLQSKAKITLTADYSGFTNGN